MSGGNGLDRSIYEEVNAINNRCFRNEKDIIANRAMMRELLDRVSAQLSGQAEVLADLQRQVSCLCERI